MENSDKKLEKKVGKIIIGVSLDFDASSPENIQDLKRIYEEIKRIYANRLKVKYHPN